LAHAGRVGKQVQPFGEAAQQIIELAEACREAQYGAAGGVPLLAAHFGIR